MKQSTRLWALIAVGAIAYASVPAQAAGGRGSIRGVVMDASGSPLIGAAVVVLAETEAAKVDKVIKRASTDSEGKFTAPGITPGRYRVKAEANGFNAVELEAEVRPTRLRYSILSSCVEQPRSPTRPLLIPIPSTPPGGHARRSSIR